jgi:long-chain acyl-CoA synthetase
MPVTVTDLPFEAADKFPDRISHKFRVEKKSETRTFAQFAVSIKELASALRELGIARGDHVGFFVNNRFEWSVTDYALQALGAVSVPRGSDTSPKEVQFIFGHSDSSFLILENTEQFIDLQTTFGQDDWKKCRSILVVDTPLGTGADLTDIPAKLKKKTVFFSDLFQRGRELLAAEPDLTDQLRQEIKLEDVLTIVYTSGTTGNPKGVMLTHANFMQNIVANTPRLEVDASRPEITVVMLPSWHVYERAFEFVCHYTALTIVYSSAGRFAADLLEEKPHLIISVPRVWESIYQKMIKAISQMPAAKRGLIAVFIKINQVFLTSLHYLRGGYIRLSDRGGFRRVMSWLRHLFLLIFMFPGHLLAGILFKPFRAKVGGRMRVATSGAGSLPKYLDEVFNALGITIVNAYGMTECAPGILSRTVACNTFGSTGRPFDHTEVEIRIEDGSLASVGEKGVLFVRGPQVMKGYYKNPEATNAVLDNDGWLNTGDLAVRSENGEVIIVGRLKDTIVLMGGENVEPENIEDKMKESMYIDHAVVLGQDQKQLTAIVAVNEEELMKLAAELKVAPADISIEGEESIEHDRIYQHLMNEVKGLISREQGFKPFEFISRILPVRNDFSIGKELTQTLKVKRQYVIDKYHGLVKKLMSDSKKK